MICSCGRPASESVLGYGNQHADIMFIGIAPGKDEWLRSKRPLTGPSGKLLDACLEAVSIKRDDVFCTNLVCFWKDAPDSQEIAACSARLQQEIREVNPKVIVLLGKIACESMLPGLKFSKARGAVVRQNGRVWLPTYHPAACLHRATTPAEKEVQIEAAYSMCRDLSKLSLGFPEWSVPKYTVVDNVEDAQAVLDKMEEQGYPISLDIETNYDKDYEEAHPFDHDIVCIGIGNSPDVAFVLTKDALPGLRWPESVTYTYHNGTFDTQEIARILGYWLPIGDDTMLMSYSVDERNTRGLHKLKNLAREFCGADFYEEDDHKLSNPPTQDQLSRMYEYNAKDVVYTTRLREYLHRWQRLEGSEQVYESLLLPGAAMLRESQYRGIYVDQERRSQVAAQFAHEWLQLKKKLNKWSLDTIGDPEFNPGSPVQVRKLLEYQGYSLPNTQKATLQQLMDDEPDIDFVPDLLRYRTLQRMCTNYIVDVTKQIKYDGRVHPHAFLIGTVTGRLTYKAPAMQTLPKPKTVRDLGIIRSVFAATNDDYILLEADYAQIEAWLGAYFSEDDVLLHDLQSGDWHTAVAVGMFGKTAADCKDEYEWPHLRDAAKHINYGSMYGEEAKGLTRRPPIGIGCDLQTAQEYLWKWRAHYPTFVKYQQEQQRLAREVGYIETPFGRKRRFPVIVNDHQLRQAVNAKIQSVGGDYTLSSAIRLHQPLKQLDTHLLFIEHDALYYEVNKANLAQAVALIKQEMERPPLPGLPSIRTEMDMGPNLADLKHFNVEELLAV